MSSFGVSLLNPGPTGGSVQKGVVPTGGMPPRKRGLPSTQSLMNPSIHTSTTEIQVNSTAAAPIFCKPFARGYEKAYGEGDILFVKKEDSASRQKNFHTVANLPVLNYFLRTTITAEGKPKYTNVGEIQKDWNFFGIMLNDMDAGSQFQRLLNVTVRGRARVPNYWSSDAGKRSAVRITKGEIIWIGFKKITHPKATMVRNPDGSFELSTTNEHYQASAILNNDRKDGGYELCIPIGVVHQLPFKNAPNNRRLAAMTVTDQGKLLDMVEVFVRI